MKIYAISDLHVGFKENRRALEALPSHPDDWLLVAGDVGESELQFEYAFGLLTRLFKKLVWVPGNHDLWTLPNDPTPLKGQAKYERLVALCRRHGVLTPEDPFPTVEVDGHPWVVAPVFALYDYTFCPDHIPQGQAISWARETDIICADESYLFPDPYPSRAAWCQSRCAITEKRLAEVPLSLPLVLVTHFPLRRDLVRLYRIPRFTIWCGTRRTEAWPGRFNVRVVVSGHLHMRATDYRDGVRYEEVSLGYPRQWRRERTLESYLRQVVPAHDSAPATGDSTLWLF